MTLPWDRFEQLAGAEQRNFEVLLRALVRRRWGRHGQLRDRLNQPGIEFHLELHEECDDLGAPPRWWGWQCKYYKLGTKKDLGKNRRKEITAAIEKAREDVPQLTDFVLCLQNLPRKADLDWYDEELQSKAPEGLRLHRWGPDDLEAYVDGGAAILRSSFFGELVLTHEALASCHEKSIGPIRKRWVPDLHVVTHVEHKLAEALLRSEGSGNLKRQAETLERLSRDLSLGLDLAPKGARKSLAEIVDQVDALATLTSGVACAFADHRPDIAAELLEHVAAPSMSLRETTDVLRLIRRLPSPAATAASTLIAEIRRTLSLVSGVRGISARPLLGLVGDAGSGKSHLSAQITAPTETRPAGLFIRGIELKRGANLDELARRIPDLGFSSFTELLEACDAAGARSGFRLPVVLDGLNEAHRPEDWPDLLDQLAPGLDRFPNVKVIVTYRGALTEHIRSEHLGEIELTLDDVEISAATDRYFTHYKIDPGQAPVPFSLFRELLFLRIYCEATNFDRHEWVGPEALPNSLVDVFGRYVTQVGDRLRARPGHPTLPPGHIQEKLRSLALRLWDRDVRELPWREAKILVDGNETEWDHSLLRALEDEGVLARDDRDGLSERTSAPLFDRLGGYLIAWAIVTTTAPASVPELLSTPDFWDRINGPHQHPLAEDITVGLVGLLPLHNLGQLWNLAPERARTAALLATLNLESRHIDDATLEALTTVVASPVSGFHRSHPFDRVWRLAASPAHRLNAQFLTRVLRSLPVARRDGSWSEWVRQRSDVLLTHVEGWRGRWETDERRSDADVLAGTAISWLQTTPDVRLRDAATRALQRLGRGRPGIIFEIAADMLDVDDPYVTERVVAAAYGTALTRQMPEPGSGFETALGRWLRRLQRAYLGDQAEHPTSHALLRSYVRGCFEFAATLHPAALPPDVDPLALRFGAGPAPEALHPGSAPRNEVDKTLHMDFANYTVGGLFPGRANYEMDHPQYVDGLAEVAGRVWGLGWRADTFEKVDGAIADARWRKRDSGPRKERYGKKYGWIAYYELAGRIADAGTLQGETWRRPREGVWPDIDPTFTSKPDASETRLPGWASQQPVDVAQWIANGEVEIPSNLLICDALGGQTGPWVLVDGYVNHEDSGRATSVWGFMHAVLVNSDDHAQLLETLRTREYLGNNFIDHVPSSNSVFSGEIPWNQRWATLADGEAGLYDARVGDWQKGIPIEILAHGYEFTEERTATVEASGHRVPSRRLAERFGLRQLPQTLDTVGLDGMRASVSLSAPAGHQGRLLYVRLELLKAYAEGRSLVQVAWGAREHSFDRYWDPPEWFSDVVRSRGNLWRRVETVF